MRLARAGYYNITLWVYPDWTTQLTFWWQVGMGARAKTSAHLRSGDSRLLCAHAIRGLERLPRVLPAPQTPWDSNYNTRTLFWTMNRQQPTTRYYDPNPAEK